MKIKNKTAWCTNNIKRLVIAVAKREVTDDHRKHLTVIVDYKRINARIIGRGAINGWWIKLLLPRPERGPVDPVLTAHLIAHELAHNLNIPHRQMDQTRRYGYVEGWRNYYAWAAEFPIRQKEAIVKTKPDAQMVRYARAQRNLLSWQRRLKFATNKFRRYRQQVARYERVLLAANKLPTKEAT